MSSKELPPPPKYARSEEERKSRMKKLKENIPKPVKKANTSHIPRLQTRSRAVPPEKPKGKTFSQTLKKSLKRSLSHLFREKQRG